MQGVGGVTMEVGIVSKGGWTVYSIAARARLHA